MATEVRELMTSEVETIGPTATIVEAATLMHDSNIGFLGMARLERELIEVIALAGRAAFDLGGINKGEPERVPEPLLDDCGQPRLQVARPRRTDHQAHFDVLQ